MTGPYPGRLADVRTSYDAVAESCAEPLRDGLVAYPHVRGALAPSAELVRDGGGPVLDAGCGPGALAGHLHGPRLEDFGIDLSPAMVEIARRGHPRGIVRARRGEL